MVVGLCTLLTQRYLPLGMDQGIAHSAGHQHDGFMQLHLLGMWLTFAASSAHKMGTPLSTLAILVNDVDECVIQRPQWHQDQKLMALQIDLCKSILQEMMQKAEGLRRNKSEAESLINVMARLREQFNLLHPRFALAISEYAQGWFGAWAVFGPCYHQSIRGRADLGERRTGHDY